MSGEVKMDGEVITPGRGGVRTLSCYIMQEDHLNPVFTALEIMMLAAELKVGGALPTKAKRLLVCKGLSLYHHSTDSRIA